MRACLSFFVGLTLIVSFSQGHRKYGAPMRVPVTDPDVIKITKWAVQQLNGDLEKIISAERQLVAGLLYTVQFTMAKSDKTHQVCNVKVWEQAWRKVKNRLLHSHCETSGYIAWI